MVKRALVDAQGNSSAALTEELVYALNSARRPRDRFPCGKKPARGENSLCSNLRIWYPRSTTLLWEYLVHGIWLKEVATGDI